MLIFELSIGLLLSISMYSRLSRLNITLFLSLSLSLCISPRHTVPFSKTYYTQGSPTFCGKWAKMGKLGTFFCSINSCFFANLPIFSLMTVFLAPWDLKRAIIFLKRATFCRQAIGWRPLLYLSHGRRFLSLIFRCTSFVCRCPSKVDPGKTADIVDTIQEVTSWSDFEKRDFIKVHAYIWAILIKVEPFGVKGRVGLWFKITH